MFARVAFVLVNALIAGLLLGLFALPSQQVIEGYPNAYPDGPLTSLIVDQAQWSQGGNFPGRVMALYWSDSTETISPEETGRTWQNTEGIAPDLLSLKTRRVTTLAPYGQLTSLGLFRELRDLFGNPGDVIPRNAIVHRRFGNTAARLFGVRFVLADSRLDDQSLRQIATTDGEPTVRLYELDDPNTSGFSPTNVEFARSWTKVRESLEAPDFDPREEVVLLQDGPNIDRLPDELHTIRSSSIRLVGAGIEVNAQLTTPGKPALLVLPFEFSHCMTLTPPPNESGSTLIPVNGVLTGLVVNQSGTFGIEAVTSPFRTPLCRLKDIEWWKRLFEPPS